MSLVGFFYYFQEFLKPACLSLLSPIKSVNDFFKTRKQSKRVRLNDCDLPPSPPYLLSPQERETCSATVKTEQKRRILYQDCISVKTYRLRFCDTCRKRKCCFPRKTRQRRIEFQVRKRGGGGYGRVKKTRERVREREREYGRVKKTRERGGGVMAGLRNKRERWRERERK